ncbi:MAG: 1-acyl-sn-glycerol-3-phosphate acyltransferase [Polyangiales bacterium]|nr:1-acyl-sn-glycerol-3-phosphate acyltransferase [Sandaracinaceae bacterium]
MRAFGQMLDLARLKRIRLTPEPLGQRLVGGVLLHANYNVPPGNVRIDVEGLERIPQEPVIFAMNHTDKYNYFPFQYYLWKRTGRLTATWVKGKYYESRAVGSFMEWTNQLPTVSRGYIIARDFLSTVGRKPTVPEYDALRHWVDDAAAIDRQPGPTPAVEVPSELLRQARSVLGCPFEPSQHSYAEAVNATYAAMMREFIGLHEQAFGCGLDLLIFPQGTRSVALTRGHVGLAQVALRYKKTVVPIGCSGSDLLYPGESPWAKPGHVRYRIGEPIAYGAVPDCTIDVPYEPFTPAAEHAHRAVFQRHVDFVMDRINDLLEPRYQYGGDPEGTVVAGTERFL